MTVTDWLDEIKALDGFPSSQKQWEGLSGEARACWLAFTDWLGEQDHPCHGVALLVVHETKHEDGWPRRLRPYGNRDGLFMWYGESCWLGHVSSDVPDRLMANFREPLWRGRDLAKAWRWLFDRVTERGF